MFKDVVNSENLLEGQNTMITKCDTEMIGLNYGGCIRSTFHTEKLKSGWISCKPQRGAVTERVEA
jgi:hypothetical protein